MKHGPFSNYVCAVLGLALSTCAGARWQVDTSPVPLLTKGGYDDPSAVVCLQPTVPGKDSLNRPLILQRHRTAKIS